MRKANDEILSLGKNLENAINVPSPITLQTWTDSKQRRLEALKKMVQGREIKSGQWKSGGIQQYSKPGDDAGKVRKG